MTYINISRNNKNQCSFSSEHCEWLVNTLKWTKSYTTMREIFITKVKKKKTILLSIWNYVFLM